jgi:hypothetical protein
MLIIAQSNRMTTIEFPSSTALPTLDNPALDAPALTPIKVDRGWHDDPFDQHELRFHDGDGWTEHVTHLGPVPCQGCHPYAR